MVEMVPTVVLAKTVKTVKTVRMVRQVHLDLRVQQALREHRAVVGEALQRPLLAKVQASAKGFFELELAMMQSQLRFDQGLAPVSSTSDQFC
jgi:hypothetical protein